MPLRDRSGLSSQPFWHGVGGRSGRSNLGSVGTRCYLRCTRSMYIFNQVRIGSLMRCGFIGSRLLIWFPFSFFPLHIPLFLLSFHVFPCFMSFHFTPFFLLRAQRSEP